MAGATRARTMGAMRWLVDAPRDTDVVWHPRDAK
jgi:hypothetical protein